MTLRNILPLFGVRTEFDDNVELVRPIPSHFP